jgi:hypothetical protein
MPLASGVWSAPHNITPVGEFRKTRHPRNVKFDKVLETCFLGTGNSWFPEAWNLWSLGFANVWNSRIVVREEVDSRTCGSPESRAGNGANFRRWPIRESIGDPIRESCAETCTNLRRSESRSREFVEGLVRGSHVKTFTNQRRSKVKVVVPKSPGFECELVADL